MKNYSKEQGVGLNQETFTFLEGGLVDHLLTLVLNSTDKKYLTSEKGE
ncbi:hypothetical protein N8385_04430 [Cyclobacteriaceae bacterium]|jgi:hypothetical protein|nr:hypothetical protein [Cyclobacteriaceae bacterium]